MKTKKVLEHLLVTVVIIGGTIATLGIAYLVFIVGIPPLHLP